MVIHAGSSSLLLKRGTVLIHDGDDVVHVHDGTDILVKDGKIAQIGEDIPVDEEIEVRIIDCTNKIISPGFVDTHHHIWQSQLKGQHGDNTLLEYMIKGNMQSYSYTAEDIFWGELVGYLEGIDAGTTTVVDHAHMTYSPEHARAAVSATLSSGIRSVFCYSPIPRIKSWSVSEGIERHPDVLPEWCLEQLGQLSQELPSETNGRVQLGLAFDLFFLSKEHVVSFFEQARRLDLHLITTHCRPGILDSAKLLASYGLMGPDLLFSHCNNISDDDLTAIKAAGAHISSTPEVELQTTVGQPEAFSPRALSVSSIGVDCHCNFSGDMVSQLRLGLQQARSVRNAAFAAHRKQPRKLEPTTRQAFNLGTINGARAAKMADQIGSIAVGKRADLVVWSTTSPAMLAAADEDPIRAIILHGSIRDIDIVIVNGEVRKENGALLPVEVTAEMAAKYCATTTTRSGTPTETKNLLSWPDIVRELRESRAAVQARINKSDMAVARKFLLQSFRMSEEAFVNSV